MITFIGDTEYGFDENVFCIGGLWNYDIEKNVIEEKHVNLTE